MRVLHVIESFGGGSAEAMRRYVASTPDLEHHLLRALRPGEHADEDLSALFSTVLDLPRNLPGAVLAIRRSVAATHPDVVHAHSTFGGAFVRLALRRSARRRLVYTPHCFAFERLDVSRKTRSFYRLAERLLAVNTTVVAACSTREARLASRFHAARPPVIVPNVAEAGHLGPRTNVDRPLVAGMGRLGPQKDPYEFARIVRRVRAKTTQPLDFIWIGDGDGAARAALEDAGVHVSGWMSSTEAVRVLGTAAAYLHTAAWEGYPLAVLEAVASDLPVIVRRIPAFEEDAPREWAYDGADDAASMIDRVLEPSGAESNLSAWRAATATNTSEHQRRALLDAYGIGS